MPDDEIQNEQNCETCGRPLNESRDFKSLRTERDNLAAERDELKQKVMDRTIRDAGFDPNLGIVKRLAKEFDGELDPEAFKTFAMTEGLTPTVDTNADTPGRTETEQQLDTLQSRGDQLRLASVQSTPEKDIRAQIAEAQAAGDWARSAALKTQLQTGAKAS